MVLKSAEVLQAQTAAYARERYHYTKDGREIYGSIGELVLARDYEPEYARYLRKVGGQRHESIAARAELLARYREFKPEADNIKTEIGIWGGKSYRHQRHIGEGGFSQVFAVPKGGREYALRLIHPFYESTHPAQRVDDHIAAGIVSRGIPHLEQLVAASYEDMATVSERIPGLPMHKVSSELLAGISDTQLEQLLATVITANQAGIIIDPHVANFLYDQDEGFGIVDFYKGKEMVYTAVRSAAGALGNFYGPTDDYFEEAPIKLDLLNRFRRVAAGRDWNQQERQEILDMIDNYAGGAASYARRAT